MKLKPRKKFSKSTKWYLISFGIGIVVVAIILTIWCIVGQINPILWLTSKWGLMCITLLIVAIIVGIGFAIKFVVHDLM